MIYFFAASLRNVAVNSGTVFGIDGTLFCIVLGGVTLGVVTFLVIVGVTCVVKQEGDISCTLRSGTVGNGSGVSFFWGKS